MPKKQFVKLPESIESSRLLAGVALRLDCSARVYGENAAHSDCALHRGMSVDDVA